MLGDFNMVEDAIDRLPMHNERDWSPESLRELKSILGLWDGWHATFPAEKAYTYHQTSTGIRSQINRIYLTKSLLEGSHEWKIQPTRIPNTDHWIVSMKISNTDIPETWKGRWSISPKVYKDTAFWEMVSLRKVGKEAIGKLDKYAPNHRTVEDNPQTIYTEFKESMMSEAWKREKAMTKFIQEAQKLQDKLKALHNIGIIVGRGTDNRKVIS